MMIELRIVSCVALLQYAGEKEYISCKSCVICARTVLAVVFNEHTRPAESTETLIAVDWKSHRALYM